MTEWGKIKKKKPLARNEPEASFFLLKYAVSDDLPREFIQQGLYLFPLLTHNSDGIINIKSYDRYY